MSTDFNKIKELDAKNYLTMCSRQNICFERGEGSTLFDTSGRAYIDFVGGLAVNSLGYNHPALVGAIIEQSQKLMHVSNLFYNVPQVTLCENLLRDTIFTRVGLCNSGAEANEMAIKLVRKYGYAKGEKKRIKIVSALNSFHGRTLATLAATGQEKYSKPFEPLPAGFVHVPFNDFAALRDAVDDTVAAVMLECIQGESGVVVPSYEYLVNAYALCKSKNILFILDEVQTGMGRTGKMFCFEHFGIQPDIITVAKGLGGGFPIGACLARGEVADAFKPGDHNSTFGGNPLACAAANVVVTLLKETSLLQHITDVGFKLNAWLVSQKKHNFVKDVRGLGLMQGIELTQKLPAAEIVGKMLSKGFLLNAAGNNTLRFIPPYVITESEVDQMGAALTEVFASTNI